MKLSISARVEDEIRAHALRDYPREACGVIVTVAGSQRYVPCRNQATGTDQFVLAPEDYARAEDLGTIAAVVHSHPDAAAWPSDGDRVCCEASGLPWVIVSIASDPASPAPIPGAVRTFYPAGWRAPLVGRAWAHGVLDCYSIIRDWFDRERGIFLPDFDRADDWWHRGQNLYLDGFPLAGFREVDLESPIRVGDVILMQIRAPVPNHAALYVGDGRILHHLHGRLSSRDVYGGYWQSVTRLRLRHESERD